jgi:hypothetical protein
LLIGINYFGQANQLKGCINDVTQMSIFLNTVYGYRREDMVILTDDQNNPMSQPTKANIIRAMYWLVKDAMPNDSLFIHFSGIFLICSWSAFIKLILSQDTVVGRQIWMAMKMMVILLLYARCQTWNMADCLLGFDDVIYPVDYKAAGHIVDDQMHDIMCV